MPVCCSPRPALRSFQACAKVAKMPGVPYVSVGTITQGLGDNANYFATSMSFRAQGRLLADYFVEKLRAATSGTGCVLRMNIPKHVGKRERLPEPSGEARKIRGRTLPPETRGRPKPRPLPPSCTAGVENIFVFTSPVFFIQLGRGRGQHGLLPDVGRHRHHDDVQRCVATDVGVQRQRPVQGSFLLAPAAFEDREDYDADFDDAMAFSIRPPPDEVVWQGWSTANQLAEMLIAAGPKWSTSSSSHVSRTHGRCERDNAGAQFLEGQPLRSPEDPRSPPWLLHRRLAHGSQEVLLTREPRASQPTS